MVKKARPEPEVEAKAVLALRPGKVDPLQVPYLACQAYQAPCQVPFHQGPSIG